MWLSNFFHVGLRYDQQVLLDVGLKAALASQLVLHQVGVVRGGNEIVAERLAHILVETQTVGFENRTLRGAQVHLEAVEGHGSLLLGCTKRDQN